MPKAFGLRLRDPRSYLLTEKWTPFVERAEGDKTGTRIRVVLTERHFGNALSDLVRRWCVAVEIPVDVNDRGNRTTVRNVPLVDNSLLAAAKVDPEGQFILRTFDIDRGGVEGQIAVVAYRDSKGEGWCDCWPADADFADNRIERLPPLADGFTALHGIAVGSEPTRNTNWSPRQWIQKCDVRTTGETISLGRFAAGRRPTPAGDLNVIAIAARAVHETASAAVLAHVSTAPRARGHGPLTIWAGY